MAVDEVSQQEHPSELEDLIPEVREIDRRRRRRRAYVGIALLLVVVLVVALLVAIGGRGTSTPLPQGMLGPAWSSSLAQANVPPGLQGWPGLTLEGLSCPVIGECVAVGARTSGRAIQAAVVAQQGGKWGSPIIVGPDPSHGSTDLRLVSCIFSETCIASTGEAPAEFLVAENHGHWSHNHVLPFSPAEEIPVATACSSDGQCWFIVTEISQTGSTDNTYAVGEKAGHWLAPFRLGSLGGKAVQHRLSGVLNARISCAAPSTCTVVGYQRYAGAPVSFAQSETEGRWGRAAPAIKTFSSLVSPNNFNWHAPLSFSCTSPNSCLFVGSHGVDQEIAGRWLAPAESVGDAGPYKDDNYPQVTCATEALCMASGYSQNARGTRVVTFAQADVAGHWQRPQLLLGLGTNGNGALIQGASCPSTSTCDLVGQFNGSKRGWGRVLSVEARYDHSRWHYWIVSLGTTRDQTAIDGLSCTRGACWVIGNERSRGGVLVRGFVYRFAVPPGGQS